MICYVGTLLHFRVPTMWLRKLICFPQKQLNLFTATCADRSSKSGESNCTQYSNMKQKKRQNNPAAPRDARTHKRNKHYVLYSLWLCVHACVCACVYVQEIRQKLRGKICHIGFASCWADLFFKNSYKKNKMAQRVTPSLNIKILWWHAVWGCIHLPASVGMLCLCDIVATVCISAFNWIKSEVRKNCLVAPPAPNILQIMVNWPFDTGSSFPFLALVQNWIPSPPLPFLWASLESLTLTWQDQASTQMSWMSFLPLRHPPSPSLGHLIHA